MSLIEIIMTVYKRCEDLKNIGEQKINVGMVMFIIEDGLSKLNADRRSGETDKEALN